MDVDMEIHCGTDPSLRVRSVGLGAVDVDMEIHCGTLGRGLLVLATGRRSGCGYGDSLRVAVLGGVLLDRLGAVDVDMEIHCGERCGFAGVGGGRSQWMWIWRFTAGRTVNLPAASSQWMQEWVCTAEQWSHRRFPA